MYFDPNSFDPKKDLPPMREYDFGGKAKVIFRKVGAHGHWVVNYEAGRLPKSLTGQFLTYQDAFRAVKAHFQSNR